VDSHPEFIPWLFSFHLHFYRVTDSVRVVEKPVDMVRLVGIFSIKAKCVAGTSVSCIFSWSGSKKSTFSMLRILLAGEESHREDIATYLCCFL
jgi:hypothetical protein